MLGLVQSMACRDKKRCAVERANTGTPGAENKNLPLLLFIFSILIRGSTDYERLSFRRSALRCGCGRRCGAEDRQAPRYCTAQQGRLAGFLFRQVGTRSSNGKMVHEKAWRNRCCRW